MRQLLAIGRRFLEEESGPTAVEYAVMLALIVIVCMAAIYTIGAKTSSNFTITAWTMQAS